MNGSRVAKIGLAILGLWAFLASIVGSFVGTPIIEVILLDFCGIISLGIAGIIDVLERMT